MTDSLDTTANVPPANRRAGQWQALCKMLNVSTPNDAISEVRALQASAEASNTDDTPSQSPNIDRELAELGLSSMEEALEELQRRRDQDNEQASDRVSLPTEEANLASASLPSSILGIHSQPAAQMTLSLAEDTESMLKDERDGCDAAPLPTATTNDILSTMHALRNHAEALCANSSASEGTDREEIGAILGVDSSAEARELRQAVHQLQPRLAQALPGADLSTDADTVHATIVQLSDRLQARTAATGSPDTTDALLPSMTPSLPASPSRSMGDGASVGPRSASEDGGPNLPSPSGSPHTQPDILLAVGVDDKHRATGGPGGVATGPSTSPRKRGRHRQQLVSRLRETIGTIGGIAGTTAASRSGSASRPSPSVSFSNAAYRLPEPDVDAGRLLPKSTLDRLDEMQQETLDTLPLCILKLDDDGTIAYVNENDLRLPNLTDRATLRGNSLFQAIPSTSNPMFLTPFRDGVAAGRMDVCFPYTFVAPGASPRAFIVQLYRAGPSGANWLLLEPA